MSNIVKSFLDTETQLATLLAREQKVVKHNDIVQRSRISLSLVEQKTINYIISLIKPPESYSDGKQPLQYEFEIREYCKVCGIDYNQGKNYHIVKDALKALRDKSVYVTLPNGNEITVSWLIRAQTNKKSGKALVEFDNLIAPYIFSIAENTTRYQLLNILPMKSKYSVRLYEICRSWANIGVKVYSVSELRWMLNIEEGKFKNFGNFRIKILDPAVSEINEHTDLFVEYETSLRGHRIEKVAFSISIKRK